MAERGDRAESGLSTAEPDWYKDAIIYELHVKAFLDKDGDGLGDFNGLIETLDYLQDLGVTCLWLLPFYPSPLKDDGYDIADYFGVHPSYGTIEQVQRLVEEVHRRDMRLITELVINHTSDQHPWFQAARRAPKGSKERDYYVWSDNDAKYEGVRIIFCDTEKSNWSWDDQAKAYYWHRFFSHQPDLNFANPEVRRAILDVMRFWLDLGVDGLRLDAVPYLCEREGTNCENLPETHQVLREMRAWLDQNYQDRMFLAEANQWPDDVRPYFGDGDECHMAFHFPVMPRIFMALRQENRFPVTEIMAETPEIPESCQWALFLRNHDELTLEMVTDEERDYMYAEYAADPQARINLGIRRRLAPLVNYSRPRLELLNSLLFSLPGTPVIYYGDEIGMGDNIYLGDRNGVRTPMQWNNDRNGGFSRADFARLYAPPIMDPVSGYQSINVEAQQRDPSSLLNWMKRLIGLRKQHPIFGRGRIEFLHPTNPKVLAYVRRFEDELVLVVANLSRFPQPCELELAEFEGLTPIEMFGNIEFPRVGELPYFVTLGPHAFFWFQLVRQATPIAVQRVPEPFERFGAIPILEVTPDWEAVLTNSARRAFESEVLPIYLPRQPWFAEAVRDREVAQIRLVEQSGALGEGLNSLLLIIEADLKPNETLRFLLMVSLIRGPISEDWSRHHPEFVIARLSGGEGGVLLDALGDETFRQALWTQIRDHEALPMQKGTVQATATTALSGLVGPDAMPATAILEPSTAQGQAAHSMIRFGDRLVLKIYRQLDAGPNPDYEVALFLTERTGFPHMPKVAGSLQYRPQRGEPVILAMLEEWVESQSTGWQYVIDEMTNYFEQIQGRLGDRVIPESTRGDFRLFWTPRPPHEPIAESPSGLSNASVEQVVGLVAGAIQLLGQRTAQMHRALAGDPDDPEFVAEPLTSDDTADLARSLRIHADQVARTLRDVRADLDGIAGELAQTCLAHIDVLAEIPARLRKLRDRGRKFRGHGRYVLDEVLRVRGDYVILDFQGNLLHSLEQRNRKRPPASDVADMLRSLGYAAYGGLFAFTRDRPEDFEAFEPWARLWHQNASGEFLRAYFDAIQAPEASDGQADSSKVPDDLWPTDPEAAQLLLVAHLLDRVYVELLDELARRPEWSVIPLRMLQTLLVSYLNQNQADKP